MYVPFPLLTQMDQSQGGMGLGFSPVQQGCHPSPCRETGNVPTNVCSYNNGTALQILLENNVHPGS